MLLAAGSGAMGWLGKSYFFSDRNTAVRGADVHSLPLNFPLKKSRIWTAGTWDIWDETLLGALDLGTCLLNYNFPGGWVAVAQKGFARCKESI